MTNSAAYLKVILYMTMCLMLTTASAQEDKGYPQGYFRNPLDIPISLAGNFGECRPNHFHSGLDIKTEGKENYPVYAAAEGYVSRMKIEKGGFGHALYVTHPNGFTTVYAHLNDFAPPLQKYLRQKQYEQQSWSVDLALSPDQFPVARGQQIAWSGNTGGSTAPHLHFEIRNTQTEHPVNPQLFGFEIRDTRPPVPTELLLYDLNRSIYEQQPRKVALTKTGEGYEVPAVIQMPATQVGLAVNVNDYMDGSQNTLNFYTARWYLDDTPMGNIQLDDIGYDVTRYLHAYIDYKKRRENGGWYQLMFKLPGNRLDHLYTELSSLNGGLSFSDTTRHSVRIDLVDAAGNMATIRLHLQSTLSIANHDSCSQRMTPDQPFSFEHPNLHFRLRPGDVYDASCLRFSRTPGPESYSDRFQVHTADVPVHGYFDLHIKANKLVPFQFRSKVVLKYSDGKRESAKAATFDTGWYKASVRAFGTYWLTVDTLPPTIKPMQAQGADLSKAKRMGFTVKDAVTSVKSFRAVLKPKEEKGKETWLCFEPYGDNYIYIFDEHVPRGKHTILVTATDENGNERRFEYNFVR